MNLERLEIRIDRAACAGNAECSFRAPATFALDNEGKAVAKDPPGDDTETIRLAAAACPRFAIEVTRTAETAR